ncbi:MAG: FAD-dependent oxidoreductase [Alphaproteobacteria bacterium]|nr:FAD-dependent oxidoreductase [Alphaproteobacteria bacterium]
MATHVTIIGGGYTGLSAAYEMARAGIRVTILEQEDYLGGLAGSFGVGGTQLEKFYHHWFTNDVHITGFIDELGLADNIVWRPSRTGMYFANNFYKLSTPLDLIRFKPISLVNRLRLGLTSLKMRRFTDWRSLEDKTAGDWLRELCGEHTFQVVWEPLLRGKFGEYWEQVSAVWIWNKIKLRGGSRSKDGAEMLGYYRGGFGSFCDELVDRLRKLDVTLMTSTSVQQLLSDGTKITGVQTPDEMYESDAVLATTAPPILAEILGMSDLSPDSCRPDFVMKLGETTYLANICLVLELDRSLSETYWLNVNDPSFPFVAIVEHTNFESIEGYDGRHLVYLSKYLPVTDPLYAMNKKEIFEFSLPHIQRMFPKFSESWIQEYHVWRARYAQPIVGTSYSKTILPFEAPIPGLYLSNMTQIYPEDRGTNYAVREGRKAGQKIAALLN